MLVAVLAIVDAALSLVERFISARVGEGLIFDMRTQVFDHVQRMPIAFFTRTQTGALVSRLNNDVTGAQQAFTDMLSSVIGNLISVGIVLVIMFFLSWQITLVALLLLPALRAAGALGGPPAAGDHARELRPQRRDEHDMIERFNVAGALLVKLFGHPEAESDALRGTRPARVRDIGITQAMYARVFFVALLLTASLATALVYGWGGVLAVHGALEVGTVVALTAYLNRLYGPLTALSNVQVDVMTALVSFDRVFEVLDLPPMIAEKPDATALPRGPGAHRVRPRRFSYPTSERGLAGLARVGRRARARRRASEVLFDVCFTAEPGPARRPGRPVGRRQDDDQPARAAPLRRARRAPCASTASTCATRRFDSLREVDRRRHPGRAPLPRHDPRQPALRQARRDRRTSSPRRCAAAQILPLVESLPDGLDTVVGDRGYRLSGGEKQRIAIARLLLKAPDIVVLDEATAHLDSESEVAVQRALKTALAGRTSLVIAHRLSTVRDADQILVLEDGRIVERGRHDELLAAGGLYAELYRTQFRRQDAGDRQRRRAGG